MGVADTEGIAAVRFQGHSPSLDDWIPGWFLVHQGHMGNTGTKSEKSPLVAPRDPEVVAKENARRKAIALELLATEKSYVKFLGVCVEIFIGPQRTTKKPVISEADARAIFSVMENIWQFQSRFLAELEERISKWDSDTRIGDVFIRLLPFMKMYEQYINNYDNAMSTLKRLDQDKAVVKFFMEAKSRPECSSQDLPSFLIMPVQRLPRYVLLLQDLVKHTPPSHPDQADLQSALKSMQALASDLNAKKKLADERQRLVQVQSMLKMTEQRRMNILVPHRIFIHEGELQYIHKKGERRRCKLIIMNDIAVLASEEKKLFSLGDETTWKFQRAFNYDQMVVSRTSNGFSLRENDEQKDFLVSSDEECGGWVAQLSNAQDAWKKKLADNELVIRRVRPEKRSRWCNLL